VGCPGLLLVDRGGAAADWHAADWDAADWDAADWDSNSSTSLLYRGGAAADWKVEPTSAARPYLLRFQGSNRLDQGSVDSKAHGSVDSTPTHSPLDRATAAWDLTIHWSRSVPDRGTAAWKVEPNGAANLSRYQGSSLGERTASGGDSHQTPS
jgi:hypothetical protein